MGEGEGRGGGRGEGRGGGEERGRGGGGEGEERGWGEGMGGGEFKLLVNVKHTSDLVILAQENEKPTISHYLPLHIL